VQQRPAGKKNQNQTLPTKPSRYLLSSSPSSGGEGSVHWEPSSGFPETKHGNDRPLTVKKTFDTLQNNQR
jgi:hypothetical protein